ARPLPCQMPWLRMLLCEEGQHYVWAARAGRRGQAHSRGLRREGGGRKKNDSRWRILGAGGE
ncbi:MAG: hypothetical protein B7X78_05200, partial [Sphingomonadales bacterium 39-62-4]